MHVAGTDIRTDEKFAIKFVSNMLLYIYMSLENCLFVVNVQRKNFTYLIFLMFRHFCDHIFKV